MKMSEVIRGIRAAALSMGAAGLLLCRQSSAEPAIDVRRNTMAQQMDPAFAAEVARSQADQARITRLPTPDVVAGRMLGATQGDTYARQLGAFEVFKDFISSAMKVHNIGGDAFLKSSEYRQAAWQLHTGTPGVSTSALREAADAYKRSKDFRMEVLSPWVAQDWLIDFEADEWDGPTREQVARQAAVETQSLNAKLDQSLAAASRAKTDLKVFGMQLGKPLQLPPCQSGMDMNPLLIAMTGKQTMKHSCVGSGGSLIHGITSMVATDPMDIPEVPGVTLVSLTLGADKCPAWVRAGMICSAVASLYGDRLIGIRVLTGAAADSVARVDKALAQKYGNKRSAGQTRTCTSRKTGLVTAQGNERVWSPAGLHVSFKPVGKTCSSGTLEIDTAFYADLASTAATQAEESDPQL